MCRERHGPPLPGAILGIPDPLGEAFRTVSRTGRILGVLFQPSFPLFSVGDALPCSCVEDVFYLASIEELLSRMARS